LPVIVSSLELILIVIYLQSLKSATTDIGRNIRREHLLVIADSMSVTGQFHAISSHGLKQQRTRLSISSPFSEACFSVSTM
jgi:DNA-directed RNA polymerase-4 subunit 1